MSEANVEQFEAEVAAMPDTSENGDDSVETLETPKSDLEKAGEVFGMVKELGGDTDATMADLVRSANEFAEVNTDSPEASDEAKIADEAAAYKILEGGDTDDTARTLGEQPLPPLETALSEIAEADSSGEAIQTIVRVLDGSDVREVGHDSLFGAGVNPESGNYDVRLMPRSEDASRNAIDDKVDSGEPLSVFESMNAGRDTVETHIGDIELLPDRAYRATDERELGAILETGYAGGRDEGDEYMEGNNKGIDWYLGGVAPRYGKIILESPARPDYFEPAIDNGTHMAKGSMARHMKSSGSAHPVPKELITVIAQDKNGIYSRIPMSQHEHR